MNRPIDIIRINNLKRIRKYPAKEFLEVMNFLTFVLELKNPFERMWMASYELPVFILNRIIKTGDYDNSEIDLIRTQLFKWCALINEGHDDECVKALFRTHLKKLI